MNKKYAVFTMDVEAFTDTECVRNGQFLVQDDLLDGFDEYIRLLDKHGIKSTLFTVGKLAPKIADRLRRYIQNGHRLALHSYEHIAPMNLSVEEFRAQTKQAKEQLSDMFQTTVEGFRAPFFSLDNARLEVLCELGFRYDSSRLGYNKARHTVELDLSGFEKIHKNVFVRDGFYEFGLPNQEIFGQPFPIGGGGYVRLSNWDFVKSLIEQYIRRNNYYVFYLHPFELTTKKIPLLKHLKWYDHFYLHYGIGHYRRKVEYIIHMLKKYGYEFVTFEGLMDVLNTNYVKKYQ